VAISIDFRKDSAGLMGVATSACALVCNDSIDRNDEDFRNRKHKGKDEI
jgi:hypothetical protein